MRSRLLILLAFALVSVAATPTRELTFNGDSMLPTIRALDKLQIVQDWTGFAKPRRGDIIVYHNEHDGERLWLKRVVALPGDRVRMRDGWLELNGKPVERKQMGRCAVTGADGKPVIGACYRESLPGADPATVEDRILMINGGLGRLDDTDVIVVPDGYVFVLGDNRRASIDSRLPSEHGLVPVGAITGRWSRDPPTKPAKP